MRGHCFGEDVAHVAGGGVGHAHRGDLVVARGADEGQLRAVVAPLVVVHGDVVAQHGAVEVGRHLEARHRLGVHINDHSAHHAHELVARQRHLPLREGGVAHLVAHHIEVAELAVVLLLGGDLLAVGRPLEDGAVAVHPARVVGGVAEVLDAVGGELRFGARAGAGDVANPEVESSNEGGALSVRRQYLGGASPAPAGHHGRHARHGRIAGGSANRCFQLTGVALARRVEGDGVAFGGEVEGGEGQGVAAELAAGGGVEGGGQLGVVEERGAGFFGAVDEEEAGAGRAGGAVPELAVLGPGGSYLAADDQRVDVLAEHLDGSVVVGCRQLLVLGLGC